MRDGMLLTPAEVWTLIGLLAVMIVVLTAVVVALLCNLCDLIRNGVDQ